jgi:hypothetical protein
MKILITDEEKIALKAEIKAGGGRARAIVLFFHLSTLLTENYGESALGRTDDLPDEQQRRVSEALRLVAVE